MPTSPRIILIGNCQAAPLGKALAALSPSLQVSPPLIVHLARPADEARWQPALAEADLLLTQPVQDGYGCAFVATRQLRQCYGDKVVVIPNLYNKAYFPDACHLAAANGRRLKGPLGDYQDAWAYEAWRAGLSVDQALARLADDDFQHERHAQATEAALAEEARREQHTDIRISDWIAEHLWRQRLFMTFNHPSRALLHQLALRIAAHCRWPVPDPEAWRQGPREPLGGIVLGLSPWVVRRRALAFPPEVDSLGQSVQLGPEIVLGEAQHYTPQTLFETFYRVFDHSPPTGQRA